MNLQQYGGKSYENITVNLKIYIDKSEQMFYNKTIPNDSEVYLNLYLIWGGREAKNQESEAISMAYLSREDIDHFAERILCDFVRAEYPDKHLCYNIDPIKLAEFYGFNIVYVTITRDGSILGQTSVKTMWTIIADQNGNDTFFYLDGKTILIDKRLQNPKCVGRRNFTIAHELAHQFINRAYPDLYEHKPYIICDYRRSVKPHREITGWREWQADTMAAALLLPKQAVEEAMFVCGLGERIKVLSKKYSEYRYNRFCEMADFLQVSKTALAYRLEQLGLLERNCLIQESQLRKGAA